jgi:hypothetical protein
MFRPCEIKSPFTKKSLRKVPSQSPFAKSLRWPRARSAPPPPAPPRRERRGWVAHAPAAPVRPRTAAAGRRIARRTARVPRTTRTTHLLRYIHKSTVLQRPASVACPFVIHTLFCNKSFVTYHTQRISKNIVNCDATATLEKISGVKAGSAISLAAGATRAPRPAAPGSHSVLHHSVLD